MDTYIVFAVILLALLAISNMALMIYIARKNGTPEGGNGLLLLQRHINELTRTLDSRMGETARQVNQSTQNQLGESAKMIRDITEKLARLDETNRQVVNFADQLQSLQDILKNPKQRGVLGEYYLETVLKNVLPPERFKLQYSFQNNETVDAVIFLEKNKMLPVDSKFSLENYNRMVEAKEPTIRLKMEKAFRSDLKERINETAKYIRPTEGTMDFAFMFIPSEGVYYDLLIKEVGGRSSARDLIEYAFREKKVIIVSPTTFMAYLQTVLQGLRSLQIEETAKEIQKRVEDLSRHLKSYDDFHGRLGGSLNTVVSHYNSSSKEFKKIDKDILRITGNSPHVEPVMIDGPEQDN
jgi:DNA recombination protein RmuC